MITIEQIKANRAKWIAALKSGKYTQGQGCLRKNGKYCCLGVAADVLGCVWEKGANNVNDKCSFNGERAHVFLPIAFHNMLGLSKDYEIKLTKLNDTNGLKFEVIANYIESLPIITE